MVSRSKTFKLEAHKPQRIIHRVANNIPTNYHLRFSAQDSGKAIAGHLTLEKAFSVLFAKKQEIIALEEEMRLETSFWNDYYSVVVETDSDMTLELSCKDSKLTGQILMVSLGIALLASLFVLFTLL